jgi:uncharacterized membrane protein YfcA
MLSLDPSAWVWAIVGALLIGLGKGGLPGVGNLTIAIYAMIFPSRESVGILLPVLICADIVAVLVWRRHTAWPYIIKLMPATLVGILVGYVILDHVDNQQVRMIIGGVLLFMTGVHFARQAWLKRGSQADTTGEAAPSLPGGRAFAISTGMLGGMATMLANAAGPVAALYLMAVKLPKNAFIGTAAWFFFIVNVVKLPMQAQLGLVTTATLPTSLFLGAFAALGALVAPLIVRHINQGLFEVLIWFFIVVAGLRLLF